VAQSNVAKITISLPKDLLDLADRLAGERSTSRSGIIAELLEREERVRVEALMEVGYREMAQENRRLAEQEFPAAAQLIKRSTRWKRSRG
jgi:metal-responsive CopG/Arc/MetJ family transcriptional regulator